MSLVDNHLDELIVEKLNLRAKPLEIADWRRLLQRIMNPSQEVTIAVVGKYTKHHDAYKSVYEAIDHAGIDLGARVLLRKVGAEEVESEGAEKVLSGADGVLVPGGFGDRGIAGKIEAIRYARERGVPYFGICLGLQCAAIEFARNVLGLADANTTESNRDCRHPVVCMLDDQFHITHLGGTTALLISVQAGTRRKAHRLRGAGYERHRQLDSTIVPCHRRPRHGSQRQPEQARGGDRALYHPWFVAVQCHPEFKSKPIQPHPLFRGFVQASLARREEKKRGTNPISVETKAVRATV